MSNISSSWNNMAMRILNLFWLISKLNQFNVQQCEYHSLRTMELSWTPLAEVNTPTVSYSLAWQPRSLCVLLHAYVQYRVRYITNMRDPLRKWPRSTITATHVQQRWRTCHRTSWYAACTPCITCTTLTWTILQAVSLLHFGAVTLCTLLWTPEQNSTSICCTIVSSSNGL